MQIVLLLVSLAGTDMTDETSEHLRSLVLSAAVLAGASVTGYVLLVVYNIGFTIVGIFPVVLVSGLWVLANASLLVSDRVSKEHRWEFVAKQFWLVPLVTAPVLGGVFALLLPGWDSAVLAWFAGLYGVDLGAFGHNAVFITIVGVAVATVFFVHGERLATMLIGAPPQSSASGAVVQSVAELKRRHEAGEIDEDEYERKLQMIVQLGTDGASEAGASTESNAKIETGDAGSSSRPES